MKKIFISLFVALFFLALFISQNNIQRIILSNFVNLSPDEALSKFYTGCNGPEEKREMESMLMDPLILAGKSVAT